MVHAIWLTEGLSSQRDLIRNIRLFAQTLQVDLTIFASHGSPVMRSCQKPIFP